MTHTDSLQGVTSSPIGKIGVQTSKDHLLSIVFLLKSDIELKPQTSIAKETIQQLHSYFADPHFAFDIPYHITVSPFQQSVLAALTAIPIGNTQTYSDIAEQLNTSPRPVGNACRHNPLPIVIPCHRIVAKAHLGGYSGAVDGEQLAIKQWLLHHEGVTFNPLK